MQFYHFSQFSYKIEFRENENNNNNKENEIELISNNGIEIGNGNEYKSIHKNTKKYKLIIIFDVY